MGAPYQGSAVKVLEHMESFGHKQLSVYTDTAAGLRAFIAIHDTTLGPALGGCRVWPYRTEEEAVTDVLRLSRAMTYKNAAAGLFLGGGKAVVLADPRTDKTEALFRAFGRFVETLGGRYVTTEDVGTTPQDMEWVAEETSHVTGLPLSQGGSGNPSQMTGFGVYQGMRACAGEVWGSDSLEGRMVAIQGFGNVAAALARHLLEDGARIIATDISEAAQERARELGATVVGPDEIYTVECDVFAPCALGGVLNPQTISGLRCKVVAGGANNQLLAIEDGDALQQRDILYAPDYIINAGGVINISCEMDAAYDAERAREKTARIYATMQRVITLARAEGVSTARAAERLAEERIHQVRQVRRVHLEG